MADPDWIRLQCRWCKEVVYLRLRLDARNNNPKNDPNRTYVGIAAARNGCDHDFFECTKEAPPALLGFREKWRGGTVMEVHRSQSTTGAPCYLLKFEVPDVDNRPNKVRNQELYTPDQLRDFVAALAALIDMRLTAKGGS